MTRDEITALMGRRLAAWAAHDASALAAIHAEDGNVASPTGGALEGRDDIEAVYRTWFAAFPDASVHQEDLVIDGDHVVQTVRLSATHAGDFFGMPPTGRHVDVLLASVMRVGGGFIQAEQRIYDFTGLLVQVGVLKAKPTT